VTGGSLRGLLYGLGRLMTDYCVFVTRLHFLLPRPSASLLVGGRGGAVLVDVTRVPEYAVRGHRINYLEISNTYDAWNLTQLNKYIRYGLMWLFVVVLCLVYLFIYLFVFFFFLLISFFNWIVTSSWPLITLSNFRILTAKRVRTSQ
jgi:hypothetical protein